MLTRDKNWAKIFAAVVSRGGCYLQEGMKKNGMYNRDFRPIFRFISETILDRAILAMDDE